MFAALNSFQVGGITPIYVSEVFSTSLYTGNGSTQTITNSIDLATKGGLVWIKCRSLPSDHRLADTITGAQKELVSNQDTAQVVAVNGITAFSSTGFSIGSASGYNNNTETFASWTFRKQPKFFDVVTYTGDGLTSQVIPHSLGSAPGCVIIKRTDSTSDWFVYHRGHSLAPSEGVLLNFTVGSSSSYRTLLDNPTSTTFTSYITNTNTNGATYVAYLFAHDSGGFGLSGADNVISCGSATVVSNSASVTLGYQPQFVMFKSVSSTPENWFIVDSQRGFPVSGLDNLLNPNLSNQEGTGYYISPTATGFNFTGAPNYTYIYIAIKAS